MADGRRAVGLLIAGYNLVQNRLLPAAAYVPANAAAALGLVALARRHGCTWDELGLEPSRMQGGVRLGLAGAMAAAGVALAAGLHPRTRRYLLDQRAAGHESSEVGYRAMVRFPFGTALFEEVAFRGVVIGMWRHAGAGARRAARVSALGFGLWHLIPAADALTGNPLGDRLGSRSSKAATVVAGALLTGLAGLALTRMRERSGSLLAPWIIHAAVNTFGYLAGVASWSRWSRSSTSGRRHRGERS